MEEEQQCLAISRLPMMSVGHPPLSLECSVVVSGSDCRSYSLSRHLTLFYAAHLAVRTPLT